MSDLVEHLLTFVLGGLVGLCFGLIFNDSSWRTEIIKHHAAHYDTVTGMWKWNEPEYKP